jgi:hypothetical protein
MAEVLNDSTGRSDGILVAKASRDYRWRRYVLVIFFFFYGLYSAYDGFYRYKKENQEFWDKYGAKGAIKEPHPGFDVQFNEGFGIGLPILSVALLCWALYHSRGAYRFDGQTLSVPGHPQIAIKSIRKIDRTKWDRKGIAFVHYQVAGSAKLGIARIDDFIYDRVATDAIFDQLEKLLGAGGEMFDPSNAMLP